MFWPLPLELTLSFGLGFKGKSCQSEGKSCHSGFVVRFSSADVASWLSACMRSELRDVLELSDALNVEETPLFAAVIDKGSSHWIEFFQSKDPGSFLTCTAFLSR